MGEKQKFAYCKGTTRQCTLEKPEDSPPSFWNRLEQKHDSILLTGIQEDDEGLGMRVKIHLTRSAYRAFTLRIRLGTPQGSPQGRFLLEFNRNLFLHPISAPLPRELDQLVKVKIGKKFIPLWSCSFSTVPLEIPHSLSTQFFVISPITTMAHFVYDFRPRQLVVGHE